MGFIAGYLLLNAFLVGLNLWGRFEAKRFLDAHSAIADAQALDAFKRMARRNMYAALVSLVMSSASVLWGLWIGWQIGLLGFVFVIAMMGILMAVALSCKALEEKTRSLECTDPALLEDYRRASGAWVKKAFPDF